MAVVDLRDLPDCLLMLRDTVSRLLNDAAKLSVDPKIFNRWRSIAAMSLVVRSIGWLTPLDC